MKLLGLILILLLPYAVYADDFQGEIYSLDPKNTTLTLTSGKGMRTLRVRAGSVITVNGVEAKFEDLNLGMTARAVSADPQVATEIKAFGVPGNTKRDTLRLPAGKGLAGQLADSRWRLPDGKEFTLQADGTTSSSWHKRTGSWKVVDDHAVELMIFNKNPKLEKAMVNPDATSIRWTSGGQMAVRVKE